MQTIQLDRASTHEIRIIYNNNFLSGYIFKFNPNKLLELAKST